MTEPYLINAEPFIDHRGVFEKIYKQKVLESPVVEINISSTTHHGTVRGLHYQIGNEWKIVKILKGVIFDVLLDIRKGSPTFLKFVSVIMIRNHQTWCIPPGFAHGYQTITDDCEVLYLHTEPYSEKDSRTIRYDDPKIGIPWPLSVGEISEKDKNVLFLTNKFKGVKT
jgi:dTDP-4-dehydrorhamnose 3,5-epimerase